MLEEILLWLIVVAAALYAARNFYRIFTGKSKGCSCDGGCDIPPPQKTLPDLKKKSS